MQAKISAGTDCLRFLSVTGGNLPAPAGNSHEVFIVRVRVDFFKTRDVSFYPVPNTLTKVTICFLWSQWWTIQIWFCFKNVEVFLAGSSNRYPKKQLAEKVFTTMKMIGNWLLSLEETILFHFDGNVCNWIPKVIWPRMDGFWGFLLENGFFRWLHICMEGNLQELLNCCSFLTTSIFFDV